VWLKFDGSGDWLGSMAKANVFSNRKHLQSLSSFLENGWIMEK